MKVVVLGGVIFDRMTLYYILVIKKMQYIRGASALHQLLKNVLHRSPVKYRW